MSDELFPSLPTTRPGSGAFRLGVLATIAVMALALVGPLPAHAGLNPTVPAPSATGEPEAADPHAQVRQSLDYLMDTYGVTEDEALRRLDLQTVAPELVDRVRQAIGEELIHVALDQAGGGNLLLLTSQPDRARAALIQVASPHAEHVRFVQSRHTGAALRAAEVDARARVAGLPNTAVDVDPATERIRVRYVGGDPGVAAAVRRLFPAATIDGVPVQVDTRPLRAGQQRACGNLHCDPVIRGGIRLLVRRDSLDPVTATWGSCTSGFNIRGSNGTAYVLTAGHCVENATMLSNRRTYMYHNGLPTLVEANASGSFADPSAPPRNDFWENTSPSPNLDYALLPFDVTGSTTLTYWHTYWLTNRPNHNMVLSTCVNGQTPEPCNSGSYGLTGVMAWANIIPQSVVCATGSGHYDIYPSNSGYIAGTRCGQIIAKDFNDSYGPGPGGRGIGVNICTRAGDSGGPLWSQQDGKAYGILHGGPPHTGACNLSDADDIGVYSPLSDILAHLGSQTGITMNLIVTANG